jgi:hypothetical protein
MTATLINLTAIRERIAALEATKPVLVGSDSGTHGKPDRYDIYEQIAGERYAIYSFGGANGCRCTEARARADTHGRIRHFPDATASIRALARELKALRRRPTQQGVRRWQVKR